MRHEYSGGGEKESGQVFVCGAGRRTVVPKKTLCRKRLQRLAHEISVLYVNPPTMTIAKRRGAGADLA